MNRIHQGSLDGFCGLYALTHIVGMTKPGEYDEITDTVFYHLLKSLEAKGRLTAAKIAGPNYGFTDLMIAEAFNGMSVKSRHRLKVAAFRQPIFRQSEYVRNAGRIFKEGCSLVITDNGGSHWLAVTGIAPDGSYICFDSTIEDPRFRREKIAWDRGLMVGPQEIIENI